MKSMDRTKARKYHQEKIGKLTAIARVHNSTQFHIIDEAVMHVIDHFNPPEGDQFRRDHCLIIGSAFLGTHVENESRCINPAAFFAAGDLHELGHTMAEAMRSDKEFAACVFNAIEVFALHEPPDNIIEP